MDGSLTIIISEIFDKTLLLKRYGKNYLLKRYDKIMCVLNRSIMFIRSN